nr:hypothetical protein [Tanacetum cinerariifolium]
MLVSCVKTSDATVNNNKSNGSLEKSTPRGATFPSGCEELVAEVCDETQIAELKIKVGSFRKARTLKGKKQPPSCKEGDVIKEGQTICYLDQFGTELPVKSDVDGEVIKILFDDGEAVGYGDPLIAVLPSFHDIIAV